MQVALKILRFNPDSDHKPHWEEYQVEVEPTDRLLDALHQVKWYQDGTLAFRRSCAHGVCGSDAMTVNNVNRLACKVLMNELGSKVSVEPLRGFPVVKDLVVDMEPFFEKYRSIKPYLITYDPDQRYGKVRQLRSLARRVASLVKNGHYPFSDRMPCKFCGEGVYERRHRNDTPVLLRGAIRGNPHDIGVALFRCTHCGHLQLFDFNAFEKHDPTGTQGPGRIALDESQA